jgi:hypothetical protein
MRKAIEIIFDPKAPYGISSARRVNAEAAFISSADNATGRIRN